MEDENVLFVYRWAFSCRSGAWARPNHEQAEENRVECSAICACAAATTVAAAGRKHRYAMFLAFSEHVSSQELYMMVVVTCWAIPLGPSANRTVLVRVVQLSWRGKPPEAERTETKHRLCRWSGKEIIENERQRPPS